MVLVDNNILSALAKVEKLHFLEKNFEEVITLPSVLKEVNRDAVKGYKFVEKINEIKSYRGGWLEIISPHNRELKEAEDILRPNISLVDAECIAVAKNRDKRFLTDDKNAGEIASNNNIEVWDFKLFVEACIKNDLLKSADELDQFLEDLERRDYYKFSNKDRNDLFNQFD